MTARNGSAGVLVACRCVEGRSSRRLIRWHRGYHRPIVSTASQSLTASPGLVLVDGDIGKQETAVEAIEVAIKRFGTIDVLVNNAGLFRTKPFTEFTTEDFNALVSTNLLGFLYITQLTVKQTLKQKSGSVVTISASLAD
jgi:NADP-dependent 3-hydroxy acid dehydrogenase YdfG